MSAVATPFAPVVEPSPAKPRVLVTGATGFLGGSLVERLARADIPVRALVRSPGKAAHLRDLGVEVMIGDIGDHDAVAAAVDDIAVVFHLAGKLLRPGEQAESYRRIHVDGTQCVLDCLRQEPRLARFVHCSTTGVLGVTGERPADEDAPLRPTNVYESSKADAERLVVRAFEDGLPAVVARPGLVYGPGDLHLLGFFRSVLDHRFRPIGRTPVWLHPVYIDDMTEALLRCALSPAAIGQCFHVAGREPVSLGDLAAEIATAAGTKPAGGSIPLPVARAIAAVGDVLPPRLRGAAPLTSGRLDFLTHSRVYRVDKAERMLDFVAGTDLTTGIAKSVAWYRRHGYLRP